MKMCIRDSYGNVLAGYYAKLMCLPVNKFIVASNSNNVLFDFLKDGVYDRNRPFYKTISPSMDILISSNLERLLYYKSGKDADYIAQLMNELEATGRYQVREDIFTSVREDFAGGYCDDAACAQSMREFYEQSGYVKMCIRDRDDTTYVISEHKHYEKTNCYLLLGKQRALLIDSGLGVADIRKITDQLTALPVSYTHL